MLYIYLWLLLVRPLKNRILCTLVGQFKDIDPGKRNKPRKHVGLQINNLLDS